MKIKYIVLLTIVAFLLFSRTDREPSVYTGRTMDVFQTIDEGIAHLDHQVVLSEKSEAESLLIASIDEVANLEESLLALEELITDSASYLGNIQLRRSSLRYLSRTRQEVLPVYEDYFQARLQEMTDNGSQQKPIAFRKSLAKTEEALTAMIGKHQRHTQTYVAMLPIQLNKEGS